MERRQHHRARICLPVRLRWSTPFAQKIESAESIDASRTGLLVSTKEPHSPGVLIWVTFPYDNSLSDGQPEIPARVVRCDEMLELVRATNARESVQTEGAFKRERAAKMSQLVRELGILDGPATRTVAFQFERQFHYTSDGNGHDNKLERRGSPRRALAVPVRVRPEGVPWFEEAMSIDFSEKGMRFRSYREYGMGDPVKVAFQDSTSTPWAVNGDVRCRVMRVAPVANSFGLDVTVCREM
jgi:hypothetical protein